MWLSLISLVETPFYVLKLLSKMKWHRFPTKKRKTFVIFAPQTCSPSVLTFTRCICVLNSWDCSALFCWVTIKSFTPIFSSSAAPSYPGCLCQPLILTWIMTQEAEIPRNIVDDSVSRESALVSLKRCIFWNLHGNMSPHVTFGQIPIAPSKKNG